MFSSVSTLSGNYSLRREPFFLTLVSRSVRSLSSHSLGADLSEDRRLPPLPRVEPLPRGPFNPFNPLNSKFLVPSPPASQEAIPVKSTWPMTEPVGAPPSPANSQDSSWQESFASQKAEWPSELSQNEIMGLIAPRNINRKPPLQQLCGRKRKGSLISGEPDDQREKHRIAEGNRRKNLSQLHRELDSRIHDFFLERAGWNPSKSLPQSKEHIVQGAIYLIDFMLMMIVQLIRQENELPQHLSEKMQPQVRCMQLQQLLANVQQRYQNMETQFKTVQQENQTLHEENQALKFQLKSYEHVFRVPKSEASSPQMYTSHSDEPNSKRQKNMLPGLRVFCDEISAGGADSPRYESVPSSGPPSFGAQSFLSNTPSTTGPPSPVTHQQLPYTIPPHSRRESMMRSP